MRRFLSGSTFVLASLAASSPALAGIGAAPAEEEEEMVIIEEEMEGEEPAGEDAKPAGETPSADLFEDETDTSAGAGAETGKQDKDSEAKQIKADMGLISVVQRQRMLKKKRFDLQPQFGITVNDPYVRHYTLGAEFNFWLTNRMALGIIGSGFIGAKTPRYDNIRFQEGLLLTANKVLWQASAHYLYNPFYGKIAIFNRALLHWESFVQVGGGVMQTQVIPRYESLHEPFRNFTGGGFVGLGGRFYLPRPIDWLSINVGGRFWIYPDKLEPINRGPDTDPMAGGTDNPDYDDPDNAKSAADTEIAFNTMIYVGVSFYLPTTFEYTTRR